MKTRALAPAALATAALMSAAAQAPDAKGEGPAPPWVGEGEVPPPAWAESVAPKAGEPGEPRELVLFSEPNRGSARRGVAAGGAALPFFGTKRGSGCTGAWWLVGPLAWTCSDEATLSAEPASAPEPPVDAAGLAAPYAFVQSAGASAYTSLDSAEEGEADRELEGGWAVAIAERRERWARTTKGLWIAQQELNNARPSLFHGQAVAGGALDFAWVVADRAAVWPGPAQRGKPSGYQPRFQLLQLAAEAPREPGGMVHLADGGWVAANDIARPRAVAPPAAVTRPLERWIDVDTATQTLVAYKGTEPLFATLVSTGRGAPGSSTITPAGVHRIWVKLLASDMANTTTEDGESRYSLEDVPYVQFFDGAVALHGTYWHGDFGRPRSHGCVNLSTLDARTLFDFTEPHLPTGWTAAFPAHIDPGTVIQVR